MTSCFINDIIDINFENTPFNLTNTIHLIGYLTPIIMLVTTAFLLRNKLNYLKIFFYGYIFNLVVNSLLKWFIKDPRPTNDWKILQLGITHHKRIGYEKYGMPSGHAQNCGFSLAFITLVFNNPFITTLYLIITLASLMQRYLYKNHTILQLIVGFIIGLFTGYVTYLCGSKYIMGNIKIKKDDYFYY